MKQKIQLYIVSILFLFAILFVIKVDIPLCFGDNCTFIGWTALLKKNVTAIFCIVFMLLGLYLYFTFNHSIVRGAPNLAKKITKIENIHSETLSFLASYIVPLACLDMDKDRSLLLLTLLLFLIGWIYVKTNLFYTNPTLAIMGFKVYKIDTEDRNGVMVITKDTLSIGNYILPRKVNDNTYFVKKKL